MARTQKTAQAPLAMATAEQTLQLLAQIDQLHVLLAARIARILLTGPLNEAQTVHYQAALSLSDELCARFRRERERQAAHLTTRKES